MQIAWDVIRKWLHRNQFIKKKLTFCVPTHQVRRLLIPMVQLKSRTPTTQLSYVLTFKALDTKATDLFSCSTSTGNSRQMLVVPMDQLILFLDG